MPRRDTVHVSNNNTPWHVFLLELSTRSGDLARSLRLSTAFTCERPSNEGWSILVAAPVFASTPGALSGTALRLAVQNGGIEVVEWPYRQGHRP